MNPLVLRLRRCARWAALVALCVSGSVSAQSRSVTYYYSDSLGSVLATADAAGNITSQADYRPFGQNSIGSQAAGPGYTGHVGDPDTGLVYMQARYYDPAIGRFLSVDPIVPTAGNVFDGNRYAYVNNNPVSLSDPTGKCAPCAAEVVYVGGAVIVAAGAGYATYMIVDQVNRQQPGTGSIVFNEAPTSGEAKDKIFEGTSPAVGAAGKKGEREGVAGGEKEAWDKIDGTEEDKGSAKVKVLSDGGVADLHNSTKSQYPQGTPSIKITDPSGKIIGTVRFPKPPPPPPQPQPKPDAPGGS